MYGVPFRRLKLDLVVVYFLDLHGVIGDSDNDLLVVRNSNSVTIIRPHIELPPVRNYVTSWETPSKVYKGSGKLAR